MDGARMSFVVALTGVGIGILGGWLDVLVKWLGDLREGRCAYGFWYNQVACCSGLSPGEVCTEWKSWSEYLGVEFIMAQSLLQSMIYVVLAIAFATSAAFLVQHYAPYAFHTGIPEIKAILGGYVFDSFLSPWTLLIKSLCLALSVASGLSLGKEGPLVHVSCCLAYAISRFFVQFRKNDSQKRKILAAAAAAGVAVAFGSPLGGVLFGLEELDTFTSETDVMWRAFVCSSIAAVSLQWVNPFGTSKLVLFEVSRVLDTWRAFELIPWVILSIGGGVLGSILLKLNIRIAIVRKNTSLGDWPILEVVCVTAITAAGCYLLVFARVQTSELVANLFQECTDPLADYHGLCNAKASWRNMYLLLVTAGLKLVLTAWTFGMMIPAGIFLPTIAIGGCIGRAMGLFTQELHKSFPSAWIFQACSPDPTLPCVSPGFYAVIGASAMMGGVTRMTISVVVILFELTGALSHVLPIMISVLISKFVADALSSPGSPDHGGIYAAWINLRGYPWLSHGRIWKDDRWEDDAGGLMTPLGELVVLRDGIDLSQAEALVKEHQYQGYPVVREKDELLGFVTRDRLNATLHSLPSLAGQTLSFTKPGSPIAQEQNSVDFSELLEDAILHIKREVPQELIVGMFQRMNLRQILITDKRGKLCGMVTKRDVVSLLNRGMEFTS